MWHAIMPLGPNSMLPFGRPFRTMRWALGCFKILEGCLYPCISLLFTTGFPQSQCLTTWLPQHFPISLPFHLIDPSKPRQITATPLCHDTVLAQPAAIWRLLPMPYEIANVLRPAMGEAVAFAGQTLEYHGKTHKKISGEWWWISPSIADPIPSHAWPLYSESICGWGGHYNVQICGRKLGPMCCPLGTSTICVFNMK